MNALQAELIELWSDGDERARDAVIASVFQDLSDIASLRLRDESSNTLQTGDLVGEAVIRLMQLNEIQWQSRAHVLAMSARLMRRILVDRARRRSAAKRAHNAVTLVTDIAGDHEDPVDMIALAEALDELERLDPERARIVEMRFFGNMTNEEIAEAMGLSLATVKRRWAVTRGWLQSSL